LFVRAEKRLPADEAFQNYVLLRILGSIDHLDDLTPPGSPANKEIPRMRNEDHIHHSWLLAGLATLISQTYSHFVSARFQIK